MTIWLPESSAVKMARIAGIRRPIGNLAVYDRGIFVQQRILPRVGVDDAQFVYSFASHV